MSRHGTAFGKNHAPRDIRWPAEQFTIDEVADPAEPQSDWCCSAHQVGDFEKIPTFFASDVPRCQDHSQKTTVERHTALPNLEDGKRIPNITAQIVEQHVAEPAADH